MRPTRAGIGLLLLLAAALPNASADAAGEAAASCRIGVNVAALYDLEPTKGSFGADLWLWASCPGRELSPLGRVDLPNARPGVEIGPAVGEAVPGGYYESQRVRGHFRHGWDMRRFPFDRQRLTIRLEEPALDAGRLMFVPDVQDSFVSPAVAAELPEWRLAGFRVVSGIDQPGSKYGFAAAHPSRYAWLEATIELQRVGVLTFVKLTLPVFAAVVFAILCLAFDPRNPSSFQNQVAILVAVLFALIINHRRSDDVIGDVGRLTLVTEIHLVTILLTILVAVLAFLDQYRAESGRPVRYPDRLAIGATSAGYAVVIAILILAAAVPG